ncbi:MAG: SLC13 family permease [Exilispira sp.]|nr:SLC13 family permease [Exilispira sp.]
MNLKLIVLLVSILMYLGIIIFSNKKVFVSIGAAIICLILGAVSLKQVFFELINWNVLMIYIGTLILADLFIVSKVPAMIADIIVDKAPNTGLAIVFLCALTGFISMFVENVATVLVIAPLAFDIAKKLKVSPVPILFSIAISSNLQGTATLVGDPPSMIFAGFVGFSFNDFFFYNGKPSIFFIVEVGAIASLFYLYFIFKKYRKKEVTEEIVKPNSYVPTILLVLMIIGLAIISFLDKGFTIKSGILCMIFGLIGLIWHFSLYKNKDEHTFEIIKRLDWETLFFLIGIFVVIGTISKVGILDDLSKWLIIRFGNNIFISFLVITFFSMLLSGFIDNVPYIIIMLPVVKVLANSFGANEFLLYYGLLIGSCLGGNITPFGASANVVSVGLLKKEGYKTNFWDFVKIGLPFTLISTIVAATINWFLMR